MAGNHRLWLPPPTFGCPSSRAMASLAYQFQSLEYIASSSTRKRNAYLPKQVAFDLRQKFHHIAMERYDLPSCRRIFYVYANVGREMRAVLCIECLANFVLL